MTIMPDNNTPVTVLNRNYSTSCSTQSSTFDETDWSLDDREVVDLPHEKERKAAAQSKFLLGQISFRRMAAGTNQPKEQQEQTKGFDTPNRKSHGRDQNRGGLFMMGRSFRLKKKNSAASNNTPLLLLSRAASGLLEAESLNKTVSSSRSSSSTSTSCPTTQAVVMNDKESQSSESITGSSPKTSMTGDSSLLLLLLPPPDKSSMNQQEDHKAENVSRLYRSGSFRLFSGRKNDDSEPCFLGSHLDRKETEIRSSGKDCPLVSVPSGTQFMGLLPRSGSFQPFAVVALDHSRNMAQNGKDSTCHSQNSCVDKTIGKNTGKTVPSTRQQTLPVHDLDAAADAATTSGGTAVKGFTRSGSYQPFPTWREEAGAVVGTKTARPGLTSARSLRDLGRISSRARTGSFQVAGNSCRRRSSSSSSSSSRDTFFRDSSSSSSLSVLGRVSSFHDLAHKAEATYDRILTESGDSPEDWMLHRKDVKVVCSPKEDAFRDMVRKAEATYELILAESGDSFRNLNVDGLSLDDDDHCDTKDQDEISGELLSPKAAEQNPTLLAARQYCIRELGGAAVNDHSEILPDDCLDK